MDSTISRNVLKLHERFTGRKILTRLEELNRTQWLSRDELIALQQKKLVRVLEYAYQFVPYYHRLFNTVLFNPSDILKDIAQIQKIPPLTKDIIRNNFNELLTTESKRRKLMTNLSTSGSTGQPLIFMQDSDFRDSVTADIQRHLGWAGLDVGELHALIWGAGFNPPFGKRIRTAMIDLIWNRFQSNAFSMTDESMGNFARLILQRKPKILFGYATSIYRFAQFIRRSSYSEIKFAAVFTSAETLLPQMREVIEATFNCRVFNRYGTLELGGVACECEAHDGLHVSVENNYVEIIHENNASQKDNIGDLLVTNLNNLGMPFIRYQIGDTGKWHYDNHCSCQRETPKLSQLEGRIVDTFWTQDGRIVWSGFAGAAFHCLAHPSIHQFQVVQKTLERMLVRLVPYENIPQSVLDEIQRAVKDTFGEGVAVEFEFPNEIPPLPSGKHCYAISELNRK